MPQLKTMTLHQQIWTLAKEVRRCEYELACLLAEMEATEGYRDYAPTMRAYAESVVGLDRGKGGDLRRIGRALPSLPTLAGAMSSGELPWTQAREVVKVATPETEGGWVARALGWTSRELQRAVRHAEVGDPAPERGALLPPAPTVLRFELADSDADFVRQVLVALRGQAGPDNSGEPLDDGELLVLMAELAAGAQQAGGAAVAVERFQTVVRTCPECETTTHMGDDERVAIEVDETTQAMAECDSLVVDMRQGKDGRAHRTVTERTRRRVLDRDNNTCAVPGCTHRGWLHMHHVVHRAHGGKHTVDNLVTLCSGHHRMLHDGNLDIESAPKGTFSFSWPRLDGSEQRQ